MAPGEQREQALVIVTAGRPAPQAGAHERHLGVGGAAGQLECGGGIEQLEALVAAEIGIGTRPVSRA
jgi:hypothetical protein